MWMAHFLHVYHWICLNGKYNYPMQTICWYSLIDCRIYCFWAFQCVCFGNTAPYFGFRLGINKVKNKNVFVENWETKIFLQIEDNDMVIIPLCRQTAKNRRNSTWLWLLCCICNQLESKTYILSGIKHVPPRSSGILFETSTLGFLSFPPVPLSYDNQ